MSARKGAKPRRRGGCVISVNPSTMYPLLRDLEERALIEGRCREIYGG